jgi:hypothetical protein
MAAAFTRWTAAPMDEQNADLAAVLEEVRSLQAAVESLRSELRPEAGEESYR